MRAEHIEKNLKKGRVDELDFRDRSSRCRCSSK